jgi:hypothetical protein
MNQPEDKLPGTAKYYERHIYPRLSETIAIGSHDDHSNAVQWIFVERPQSESQREE